MKQNNDDNGKLTSEDMLKLIEEGNFQGKTIDAKAISAYQIAKLKKAGWKYMRMEPEGEILRCYFVRD